MVGLGDLRGLSQSMILQGSEGLDNIIC